jgi:sialic acid synthase SpsE
MQINGRRIGPGEPVYVVAEIGANHGGDITRGEELIRAAARAGADAVKIQYYEPDDMVARENTYRLSGWSPWDGRTLREVYEEGATSLALVEHFLKVAQDVGITLFSSVFTPEGVGELVELGIPALKVASAEITDIPLLEAIAETRLPVIVSTGIAGRREIKAAEEALDWYDESFNKGAEVAWLVANTNYPTPEGESNIERIRTLLYDYDYDFTVVGLSDHTRGRGVPVMAVGLGAKIIEKHLKLEDGGLDAEFSLDEAAFRKMVEHVRLAESVIGDGDIPETGEDLPGYELRRSLYAVEDIPEGAPITRDNVRPLRPGDGLNPNNLNKILGKVTRTNIRRGTPIKLEDYNPR